jgi:hypothetical protein
MHPLGTYLAITDIQREYGWGQAKVRPTAFARVDATPLTEPEPVSRSNAWPPCCGGASCGRPAPDSP